MTSTASTTLHDLLTSMSPEACKDITWRRNILELIGQNRNLLVSPVDGKIPLEVFILKLKVLDQECSETQENVKVVLEALLDDDSAFYKNSEQKLPIEVLLVEMNEYSSSNQTENGRFKLYLEALQLMASYIQKKPSDANVLGSCLHDTVCSKQLSQNNPTTWYDAVKILLDSGAPVEFEKGSTPLISLTCRLIEIMPWKNNEIRRNYMKVIPLLVTPRQLDTAFKFLALAASNVMKKPGCVETVSEMLDILLNAHEDSKQFLDFFLYMALTSGIGIKRIQPCNAAWADIAEYAISKGADIDYRYPLTEKISIPILHTLMTVPYSVEDVCQENLDAFQKVLDLLVTATTVHATDGATGLNTPLSVLRDARPLATTDGQNKLFAIAENKLISAFPLPEQLYYYVKSTFKEDFESSLTEGMVERVEITIRKCQEAQMSLLWQDEKFYNYSALHWFLFAIDELFPHPNDMKKELYLKVLKLLLVPELLMSVTSKGYLPLDILILAARETLQVSENLDLYKEVVERLLDAYSTIDTTPSSISAILSKALGYLVDQYALVTQPGENTYFSIFDLFVEHGARVTFRVWKKYFIDINTEDSRKFHGMAASHTKPYVQLVHRIVDALDETSGDFKGNKLHWGFKHFKDLYVIPRKVARIISDIQDQIVNKGMKCHEDFIILLKGAIKDKEFGKLTEILNNFETSWMKRSALHILAMLCDDGKLYETLNEHSKLEIAHLLKTLDLHGNTPHALAVIHQNGRAAQFILDCGTTLEHKDRFECSAHDLLRRNTVSWDQAGQFLCSKEEDIANCDIDYFKSNLSLLNAVENNALQGKMSLPSYPEGQSYVQPTVEDFFSRMADYIVAKHPWLECKLRMAGSIGEKTKIGRTDEFDIQFIFTALSSEVEILHIGGSNVSTVQLKQGEFRNSLPNDLLFEEGTLNVHTFGTILHKEFINSLTSEEVCKLPIRAIKTSNPWLIVWEQSDSMKGLEISIDLVPIIQIEEDIVNSCIRDGNESSGKGTPMEYKPDVLKEKQGKIIQNSRSRPMKLFLRWGRPGREHRLVPTIADFERDLIDSLLPKMRQGIKIVKSLLEIAYWVDGGYYNDVAKPITSYMVKNSTFWLVKQVIEGGGLLSVIDKFGRLAKDMPGMKSSENLHRSIQGLFGIIPGKVLDTYPELLDLVGDDSIGDINFSALNKIGRSKIAGSLSMISKLDDASIIDFSGTSNEESQCGSLEKLTVPPVMDDSFAVSKRTTISCKEDIGLSSQTTERTLTQPCEDMVQLSEVTEKADQFSPKDTKATTSDAQASQSSPNLLALTWAFEIVSHLRNETSKQFGLPIYFSPDANPDFLINKWNSGSIRKMCDRLLGWIVPLVECSVDCKK